MEENQEQAVFNAQKFHLFLNGLTHQWLQTLTLIGMFLLPLFGILDYFLMPAKDMLARFWLYRLANTLILLAQYLIIRATKPSDYSFLHGYFAATVTSLTVIQMTVDLGGFNSNYFQGLNLVIMAVNLLIPWRPLHSALNGSLTLLAYVIINLLAQQEYDPKLLVNHLFFMSATIFISVAINYVSHNLIKKEYSLRFELKAARDALWGEMEIAKKIQTALLPVDNQVRDYEIHAVMLPADEVGGDYYDIIQTPFGETWLAIGDVSGHGVESGLIMMMTHTSIYSLISESKDRHPSEILDKLNYVIKEDIHRLNVSRYMTLTIFKLEKDSFVHAGKHQDILIYRAETGQVEEIPSQGTWIGIADEIGKYLDDSKIDMKKGDVMLLYTDGLTEAENADEKMYSIETLIEVFQKNAKLPVKNIVDNILNDVLLYQKKQADDITILACKKI